MRTSIGRIVLVVMGGALLMLGSLSVPATALDDDASPTPEASEAPEPAPESSMPGTPSESPSPSAASSATDEPAVKPTPGTAAAGDAGAAARNDRRRRRASASVDVVDDAFQPSQVTIDVGDEVTWTSSGQHPHTVTADDGSFASGDLATGDSFSTTFDRAGSFPFYCEFHGGPGGTGMSGVVVVRAAGGGTEGGTGGAADGTTDLPPTGTDPLPLVVAGSVLALVGAAALLARRGVSAGDR